MCRKCSAVGKAGWEVTCDNVSEYPAMNKLFPWHGDWVIVSGVFLKITIQMCKFLCYPLFLLPALLRDKNIENKTMTLKKKNIIFPLAARTFFFLNLWGQRPSSADLKWLESANSPQICTYFFSPWYISRKTLLQQPRWSGELWPLCVIFKIVCYWSGYSATYKFGLGGAQL